VRRSAILPVGIFALSLGLLTGVVGCEQLAQETDDQAAREVGILPASSLSIPLAAVQKVNWQAPDTQGEIRTNEDFAGEVLALYFGFTHCASACPTAMAKLAQAHRKLAAEGADFDVALVSVDPARDSPEQLAEYVARFNPAFIGIRPLAEQLKQLKSGFRVFSQRASDAADYDINHSGLIYLIDCNGRARLAIRPEQSAEDIVVEIRPLLVEPACV